MLDALHTIGDFEYLYVGGAELGCGLCGQYCTDGCWILARYDECQTYSTPFSKPTYGGIRDKVGWT